MVKIKITKITIVDHRCQYDHHRRSSSSMSIMREKASMREHGSESQSGHVAACQRGEGKTPVTTEGLGLSRTPGGGESYRLSWKLTVAATNNKKQTRGNTSIAQIIQIIQISQTTPSTAATA